MFLQNVKIEFPCDLAIPLLGLYPKNSRKSYMYLNIHGSVIYNCKVFKHFKHPSTDKWTKMWYTSIHTHTCTHNGMLLVHKKEWYFSICSNIYGLGGHRGAWCVTGHGVAESDMTEWLTLSLALQLYSLILYIANYSSIYLGSPPVQATHLGWILTVSVMLHPILSVQKFLMLGRREPSDAGVHKCSERLKMIILTL